MDSDSNIYLTIRNRETQGTKENSTKRDLDLYLEDKAAQPNTYKELCPNAQTRSTMVLDFSHDGKYIASGHGNHTIRITEIATGKCLRVLEGHPRTPWTICFHPTFSNLLASGCLGGHVFIWDISNGCHNKWLYPEIRSISSITFHPTKKSLLIGVHDRIYRWNWDEENTPQLLCTTVRNERVRWLKFSPCGETLYTGVSNSPSTIHCTCSTLNRPSSSYNQSFEGFVVRTDPAYRRARNLLLIDPSEEDDEDLDGVFGGGVEGAWGRNNNLWGDLERMRNSARRGRGGRLYRGRNNEEDDVAASGVSGRGSHRGRMANNGTNNNNAHFMDFNDDNDEEDDSSNSEDNDTGNNNGNSFNEFVPQLLLNRRWMRYPFRHSRVLRSSTNRSVNNTNTQPASSLNSSIFQSFTLPSVIQRPTISQVSSSPSSSIVSTSTRSSIQLLSSHFPSSSHITSTSSFPSSSLMSSSLSSLSSSASTFLSTLSTFSTPVISSSSVLSTPQSIATTTTIMSTSTTATSTTSSTPLTRLTPLMQQLQSLVDLLSSFEQYLQSIPQYQQQLQMLVQRRESLSQIQQLIQRVNSMQQRGRLNDSLGDLIRTQQADLLKCLLNLLKPLSSSAPFSSSSSSSSSSPMLLSTTSPFLSSSPSSLLTTTSSLLQPLTSSSIPSTSKQVMQPSTSKETPCTSKAISKKPAKRNEDEKKKDDEEDDDDDAKASKSKKIKLELEDNDKKLKTKSKITSGDNSLEELLDMNNDSNDNDLDIDNYINNTIRIISNGNDLLERANDDMEENIREMREQSERLRHMVNAIDGCLGGATTNTTHYQANRGIINVDSDNNSGNVREQIIADTSVITSIAISLASNSSVAPSTISFCHTTTITTSFVNTTLSSSNSNPSSSIMNSGTSTSRNYGTNRTDLDISGLMLPVIRLRNVLSSAGSNESIRGSSSNSTSSSSSNSSSGSLFANLPDDNLETTANRRFSSDFANRRQYSTTAYNNEDVMNRIGGNSGLNGNLMFMNLDNDYVNNILNENLETSANRRLNTSLNSSNTTSNNEDRSGPSSYNSLRNRSRTLLGSWLGGNNDTEEDADLISHSVIRGTPSRRDTVHLSNNRNTSDGVNEDEDEGVTGRRNLRQIVFRIHNRINRFIENSFSNTRNQRNNNLDSNNNDTSVSTNMNENNSSSIGMAVSSNSTRPIETSYYRSDGRRPSLQRLELRPRRIHRNRNDIPREFYSHRERLVYANHSCYLSQRIQAWKYSDSCPVDLTDYSNYIVVSTARIHNDSTVEVSSDGTVLATFLAEKSRNFDRVGVFSLKIRNLGECMHTINTYTSAVSLSLSPSNKYLLIGTSRTNYNFFAPRVGELSVLIGQVYKLSPPTWKEKGSYNQYSLIKHPIEHSSSHFPITTNCARWLPANHGGLAYGTSRGDLIELSARLFLPKSQRHNKNNDEEDPSDNENNLDNAPSIDEIEYELDFLDAIYL